MVFADARAALGPGCTSSLPLPQAAYPPRDPRLTRSARKAEGVLHGQIFRQLPASLCRRLLSGSERLAFRNVVSTHCTHNSTSQITAHNHRKCRLSGRRARSRVSCHTCYAWQRVHTHTHTRCPQTHVRHTHHSAPLIPSTCPEDPWAPAVRGEDLIFFFFSITVATLLPILCLVHNGQELLRKSILAPFQAPEGMGPEIVLFQLWEGRPTMACLGSGTIASRSLAAWGQMSTQHLLCMPTKSHCPLNQALFCHWNILSAFLCLLKSSPFLDALHKPHLP